jgi:hypothetical protein
MLLLREDHSLHFLEDAVLQLFEFREFLAHGVEGGLVLGGGLLERGLIKGGVVQSSGMVTGCEAVGGGKPEHEVGPGGWAEVGG